MTLWNWLLTKLGKRFPLPPRHILTYEEIEKYWDSMDARWQRQCKVIVLRIRKPMKGDEKPNVLILSASSIQREHANHDWFPTLSDIFIKLGRPDQPGDPFTIRIDREWEVVPGIKKKEEVCIANFEL